MKKGTFNCYCFSRSSDGEWFHPNGGIFPKVWFGIDRGRFRIIMFAFSFTMFRGETKKTPPDTKNLEAAQ